MNYKKSLLFLAPYIFLILISFYINYWSGSRGVWPVDTFVHFDSAVRFLNNELPIRDFWIIHGLFIDMIQAFLFKIFGINWKSYLIHGSLFNSIIAVFTFKILSELELNKIICFILTLCLSILAYPVSGTPFLDLHSVYLSLISMYLLILFVKYNDYSKLFISILLLGFAFLSKQVPAAYFIICTSLIIFLYSYSKESLKPILISIFSVIFFILITLSYFIVSKTDIRDFFIQYIIFPSSIGKFRYDNYLLDINNVFLNLKFIHLALFATLGIFILNLKKKINFKSKDVFYLLILISFTFSMIFHQLHTKNQIFIFFLIPLLSSFFLYFSKENKWENKKYLNGLVIIFCIFVTIKYHIRFNEMRKFHELSSTNINQAIEIDFEKDFFNGLKWITPNFEDPKKELKIIKEFLISMRERNDKNIIITRYTFLAGLLENSTYSPSRTFDHISTPLLGNEYFDDYKIFFKKNIIKNNIDNIFIFNPGFKITENNLKNVIFNYLPNDCYLVEDLNEYTKKIVIKKCKYLVPE